MLQITGIKKQMIIPEERIIRAAETRFGNPRNEYKVYQNEKTEMLEKRG